MHGIGRLYEKKNSMNPNWTGSLKTEVEMSGFLFTRSIFYIAIMYSLAIHKSHFLQAHVRIPPDFEPDSSALN